MVLLVLILRVAIEMASVDSEMQAKLVKIQ